MRASVHTDSRINIFASGEDAELKGNAFSVFLIFVLLPNFLGEESAAGRLAAIREHWVVDEVIWGLEVLSNDSASWNISRSGI